MNFRCGVNYLFVHSCKNQTHLGQILFTLVSKNKIVPVIQQVQRQSLQMGQFVDFREESPTLSVGERNNELVPVHIPEITQAYKSTLICSFCFYEEREIHFTD